MQRARGHSRGAPPAARRELRLFGDYMTDQVARIRRIVAVLQRERARYALIGGHAVSFHARPRVTVDVDFLVASRSLPRVEAALRTEGFPVERRGDVLRVWDPDADTSADEPVVDLIAAENNQAQAEALRTALRADYQGVPLRVVTRGALVALKFLSATSPARQHGDKLQDAADISRIVKTAWKIREAAEAHRVAELWRPGAGAELEKLVDDLLHDRPVTI